jgi:hypothetical protein
MRRRRREEEKEDYILEIMQLISLPYSLQVILSIKPNVCLSVCVFRVGSIRAKLSLEVPRHPGIVLRVGAM